MTSTSPNPNEMIEAIRSASKNRIAGIAAPQTKKALLAITDVSSIYLSNA
jgi:hypothetical protein